jgi:hypothetical protein
MSNQLAERELDRVESEHDLTLGRDHRRDIGDEDYYPQIERAIRTEAAAMAPHYEVFYSLERTIRALVADTLKSAEGDSWWDEKVNQAIRTNAEKAQKREIDDGVTPRSDHPIDYTNFGDLAVATQNVVPARRVELRAACGRESRVVGRSCSGSASRRGPRSSPLSSRRPLRRPNGW